MRTELDHDRRGWRLQCRQSAAPKVDDRRCSTCILSSYIVGVEVPGRRNPGMETLVVGAEIESVAGCTRVGGLDVCFQFYIFVYPA